MRALLRIGNEAISSFESILGFEGVTGLTIQTDALLRELWRARTRLGDGEWTELDGLLAEWLQYPREYLYRGIPDLAALIRHAMTSLGVDPGADHRTIPVDPSWHCHAFDSSWRTRSAAPTSDAGVIFTVLYDPAIAGPSYNNLTGIASELPYRVRFSPRPIATALRGGKQAYSPLLGGISVGEQNRNASGTLGGRLDIGETRYGVTCGHVIAAARNAVQPSHPDGGYVIGACAHSTEGTLVSTSDGCRARGVANSVDAALLKFDVDMKSEVRKVGDVARMVPLDDVVEGEHVVVSARSGQKLLEIGAFVLRRSISIDGQTYCFQDLFEVRRRGTNWGLKGSASPPSKAGDSGAWVLRPEATSYEWLGMVTAGDGPCSYAQFAETVSDWATAEVSASSSLSAGG